MSVIRIKPGVKFDVMSPGGIRILHAVDQAALMLAQEIWITSGTNGEHSGPTDPHHRGDAYDIDVEPHDTDKLQRVVDTVMYNLMQYAPDRFYGFVEDPGTPNIHGHIQVKKGTVYP